MELGLGPWVMDRANDITYYEVAAWGRVGVRVRRACPDPPGEG